jgi:putative membrane protein insertion efficiency factor
MIMITFCPDWGFRPVDKPEAIQMLEPAATRRLSPAGALLVLLIRIYRATLSKIMPSRCRFYPSCAQYAQEAIEVHGAVRGGWLGIRRLLKCHPFHSGGFDPVPR